MFGSKPNLDEVKTWEQVSYRRSRTYRYGKPFGYVYLLDEEGDWHKHGRYGWHRVDRKHRVVSTSNKVGVDAN